MSYLNAKHQKPNPFEERKQEFYKLIRENCVMKKSNLITRMGVSPDKFNREYKLYIESLDGVVQYDQKSQRFLFTMKDVIIDEDYCTGRIEGKQEYVSQYTQETIVS